MPTKRTLNKEPGTALFSAIILLWAGLSLIGDAQAGSLHRHGCEQPVEDTQVCWDAIGNAGEDPAPFSEVHLLPIALARQGDAKLLTDYSRTVFRQFLPSGFADTLVQEWTPATHLEEAIALTRLHQWGLTLWISPRILRESSANSPGIVDWDVYLIKHSKLLRTVRVRVESRPTRASKNVEVGTSVGAMLLAAGAATAHPFATAGTMAGAVAMSPSHPPEAGRSLELMTEFAVRQLLTSFKYPMEQLETQKEASQTAKRFSGWSERFFTPK